MVFKQYVFVWITSTAAHGMRDLTRLFREDLRSRISHSHNASPHLRPFWKLKHPNTELQRDALSQEPDMTLLLCKALFLQRGYCEKCDAFMSL